MQVFKSVSASISCLMLLASLAGQADAQYAHQAALPFASLLTPAAGDYPYVMISDSSLNCVAGQVVANGGVIPCWVHYNGTVWQYVTTSQVPASLVSGLANSATTDTTNATNITSGTLPAVRLGTTQTPQFGSVGVGAPANTTVGTITVGNSTVAGALYIGSTGAPLISFSGSSNARIEGVSGGLDIGDPLSSGRKVTITKGDHLGFVGAPTLTANGTCGNGDTLTSGSSDAVGQFTTGSTGTISQCNLTFAATYTSAPFGCLVWDETVGTILSYTANTSQMIVPITAASHNVGWFCLGPQT